MDNSTIGIVITTVLAAVALSVQISGLEEKGLARLTSFWKRWAWRGCLLLLALFAAAGIYGFWTAPGPPTRSNVVSLVVSILNLLSVPFILFVDALVDALKARDERRAVAFSALEQKLATLTGMPKTDAPECARRTNAPPQV